MKNSITCICLTLLCSLVVLNSCSNNNSNYDVENSKYRTDIQPLIDRFGETIDVQSCFWKANMIGKTNIGPSSYWMKGFIIINEEDLYGLKTQYNMSKTSVEFDKGINPEITGFKDFDWQYNKELSKKLIGTGFIGEFYLDIKNGVLYFNLESN